MLNYNTNKREKVVYVCVSMGLRMRKEERNKREGRKKGEREHSYFVFEELLIEGRGRW